MEYTYNLAEIRGIIDSLLSDMSSSMTQAEESLQINNQTQTETELTDSHISAETGEKEPDAGDIGNQTGQDNSRFVEVGAVNHLEMAPTVEGSVSTATTLDQKLVEEDMSLKVVMTYYFYVDDSPESVDGLTGSTQLKDSETTLDKKDFSEDSGKDSGAEYDPENSSEGDSCDFDADIDSLDDDESCGQSCKLQSFSMMNIFDSVYEDNFDFTGSVDFSDGIPYRERVGSDSDKDTLDWLSDSSEDMLSTKHEEEIEREFVDDEQESCAAATGDTSDTTLTTSTLDAATKFYKGGSIGSTFSVSKSNSETRQKFMKRLFRKVFPKKKYVVNKKK